VLYVELLALVFCLLDCIKSRGYFGGIMGIKDARHNGVGAGDEPFFFEYVKGVLYE